MSTLGSGNSLNKRFAHTPSGTDDCDITHGFAPKNSS
jgi:hypothetical protein